MRTLTTVLLMVCTLLFIPNVALAQEESKSQAYWIHEDVVKPSMVAEYEAVCKELTDHMKKHNIQEMNSMVASTADSRYLWIGPI